ncbi:MULTISPECIES: phosphotransferase family protein [Tsukamurella]|uniref:Phosphotransferase family protein n=2 Tax=Tsukamurella TaxID=2060 RepID=A0A5C5RYM5_9ACTN|nr:MULTISPECIES: phosphotransferase family protein [Tsukamurella]NMD54296.1 phosphotransferase family protein [Tsukamurella columbiensis]TWS28189.1 phosphotransferase family protein [Tsukamurella conjunctivitidis]
MSESDTFAEQARPASSQRTPDEVRARLQEWFAAREPGAEVSDLHLPEGNGMSSETLLATVRTDGEERRLVIRVAPRPESDPVFPSYDLFAQFAVMRHVAAHGVPAPACLWVEEDPAVIGAPFLVMDRVDGEVPPDVMPYTFGAWRPDSTDADLRQLADASVDVIATIHAVPPPADGLVPVPEAGETALAAHLRRLRAFYDWAAEGHRRAPILDRALAWAAEQLPGHADAVLNWGDARIGNLMYRGNVPVAVLDWEMATVGPCELDLGWFVYLHRFFQDLAELAGLPGLPGFLRRQDVERRYAERTGHIPREMDFYTAYAAIVHGVIMYRIQTRAIDFGASAAPEDPDDMILHRASIEKMLDGTYWEAVP